jgi:hypothetical protein
MGYLISLMVLGCHVQVLCADAEIHALLAANYGAMQGGGGDVVLRYWVSRAAQPAAFCITRAGHPSLVASDARDLLFLLEQDLIIALQWLRCDLYFLHAAALAEAGYALLLVAASGQGKSTLTWALLHHGFRYLSDELGPVDLTTRAVYSYPHALCLKNEPPGPYPLPPQTLSTSRAFYVPTDALPSTVYSEPTCLAAILFLRYRPGRSEPVLRLLSPAQASARLLSQALNPLAHPSAGLDGAIAIAMSTTCFELQTADLPTTCALVTTTWQGLIHAP